MLPEHLRTLFLVVEALERLSIRYAISGSMASGVFGEPRSTHDVDFLVSLRPEQVGALVVELTPNFHVFEHAIHDAIARRGSFNVMSRKQAVKVDLFVAGDGLLDREQLERKVLRPMTPDDPRRVFVSSPEDIVLRKLDWYRMTDGTSERQWRDVLGVLKTSRKIVDVEYLERTAAALGLNELLDRALRESGVA